MAPLSLYEQLELVNQTQRDDIVSTDTCCASEVVLINQLPSFSSECLFIPN